MKDSLSPLLAIGTDDLAQATPPLVFISAFAPGENGAIHAFQFDSNNGVLEPLHRTTDIQNPFFLVISPDRRFLYATEAKQFAGPEVSLVASYAVEGRKGQLKRTSQQSTRGTTSCYLDIDATSKTLLVANYSSGSVTALPVHKDGTLGESTSLILHGTAETDATPPKAVNAHSIVVSPDNRFALSADLGIDQILIYRLDAAIGKLEPNEAQPFIKVASGSGPRHLTFHPNGKRVYVINENLNTVTFFDYATASARLTEQQTIATLPANFNGESICADLKITPDGNFLYGTNRGHDSIAAYRIGDDGKLTLVNIQPSLGKAPQNLLITPDGQWLLCANMEGNSVVVFRIEAGTGKLSAVNEPVSMPMPSCIRWLP
jgi:6-phosphogluconolactonase